MMNIILVFLFCTGLIFYYKKTLFVVACFFPILNMFGGLGPVSLMNIGGIVAFGIAISRDRREVKQCPIFYVALFYIVICVISNYINDVHTPSMLAHISTTVLSPIVLWGAIRSKKGIKLFLKVWTIYFIIICIYGYIEAVTDNNPFAEWACDENNTLFGGYYSSAHGGYRFGMRRIQSLMIYRDACGAISALFWGILYYFRRYRPEYIDTKWMRYTTTALMFMLPVTVLFTGTRACIAILVICLLGTINKIKMNYLILICLIGIFVYIVAEPLFDSIYRSFIETDSVAGSNLDMRQNQLNAVLLTLKQSPLFGNGFGSWLDYSEWSDELFGAESIWFQILLKIGCLGALAYLLIMLFLARHITHSKMNYALVVLVAYLVGLTLSSLPGLDSPLLFIFISVMARACQKEYIYKK